MAAGCSARVGERSNTTPLPERITPAASKPDPTVPVPTAGDRVTFTDITAQAGIRWRHFSGARGRKFMPESESPGCAFFDYDGDGRPDILLLNDAEWPGGKTGSQQTHLALYHNEGNGLFTDVTRGSGLDIEMYAMGVAVGDYDNDGREDLYITCVLGSSHLFHNDGNGHFTDVTRQAGVENAGRWGTSCAWVDYDRDGKLDLVVGNYCRWTPATDVVCRDKDGHKTYCTPTVYQGESCRLYHNEGHGRFRDVTERAGLTNPPGKTLGVAILDYDDDGWPDIVFANDTEPNCLFHNERNGTFKEVGLAAGVALPDSGVPRAGMGIDAGDIDNSGRPSLLISNFSGEGFSLFQNQGGGLFRDAGADWGVHATSLQRMGWGLFFFDYDLDGHMDALAVTGHLYPEVARYHPELTYAEPPLLFHNTGRRFEDVSADHGVDLSRPLVGRGAAYADIDGDGDLDVLLTANDGAPRLLRNDGGNRNHWLRITTVGTKSNRDGIGAKLVLEAGSLKQTRWVSSGSSYLSASERTVTFGLGAATGVDRLTIVWPSGQVDHYAHLKADQVLIAREGVSKTGD
jgi:hypothetical protein